MKELNKPETEIRVDAEKKLEYKLVGATRRRRGLKLFALDSTSGAVYEVAVEDKKTLDLTDDKGVGKFQANIHPDHKLLWALNISNALRKFYNDKNNKVVVELQGVDSDSIANSGIDSLAADSLE